MGVRDQNMRHGFMRQRLQQRVDMRLVERSGIDHRHIAMTDDIGARTLEGERPGVACDQPSYLRCNGFQSSVFERQLTSLGNVHGMWRGSAASLGCCLR